jgi:hypothetical protein
MVEPMWQVPLALTSIAPLEHWADVPVSSSVVFTRVALKSRRGIIPGAGPQLPLAYGSSNLPNAIGNMGGMQNAQFFGGPQLGQMPAGFQGKYVS